MKIKQGDKILVGGSKGETGFTATVLEIRYGILGKYYVCAWTISSEKYHPPKELMDVGKIMWWNVLGNAANLTYVTET